MEVATLELIAAGQTKKGDPIKVAELAGIMAGKKTADLIPLCHALPGASVLVSLEVDPDLPGVRARAEAIVTGQSGVEMEALTAVSVALLTVYDMAKAVDRGMRTRLVILRQGGGQFGYGREACWVGYLALRDMYKRIQRFKQRMRKFTVVVKVTANE